jgi:predicted nucleic acid-binding protein
MILLDTSGLLCSHDENDFRHGDAVTYYDAEPRRLTTSYVLAEFVALADTRRLPRVRALRFLTDLTKSSTVEAIWVDAGLNGEALQLLRHRQEISFWLPERVEERITVADIIARGFEQLQTLVRLTDWPMFTRREMRAFQAWRERYGCPSRLVDAPGFMFDGGVNSEPGRALLSFVLGYRWDADALLASGDAFLWIQPCAAGLTLAREQDSQAWRAALTAAGLTLAPGDARRGPGVL